MKKKPFCPAPGGLPEGDQEPEAAVPAQDSYILLCDVLIAGSDSAVGIKYDEENMFVPMIVMLEKGSPAYALIHSAETLGVPVVKNFILAKNLVSYGKAGAAIPELTYRDVSMVLARLGSQGHMRRSPGFWEKSRNVPAGIRRPLALELGDTLFTLTGEDPGRDKLLGEPLDAIRKKLKRLLGLSIPVFRISRSTKLRNDEYRIIFRGLEAGRGRLELGWYRTGPGTGVCDWPGVDRAYPKGIPAVSFPDVMNIPENLRMAAKASSLMILRHVREIVQRRAPDLLGRDEVEAILDAAEEKYPVVTGEVKNLLPLGIIREILQGLVSEQVSIRHIAIILETLADWGSFGTVSSGMIIEQIRQSLKRQICLEYADEKLTLRVLTLEQKMDDELAGQSQGSANSGAFSADSAPWTRDWENVISTAVRGMEQKGYPPVILCSPGARFPVKEATRRKLPDLAVLSYMEIPQDIRVVPVGEISVKR